MTTIADIFKHSVTPYTNSKAAPLLSPDPSLLYGLELEIEGIRVDPEELYVTGMYGAVDNSLRNTDGGRGWEYITKPATFSIVNLILTRFFKQEAIQEATYSERCSVHVHCNVLDMTVEQVKALCLLYQTFEGLMYVYAGADRDKNIFCVPWAQTQITYNLLDNLTEGHIGGLRSWQKYTGLNLIPITTQGTVEFRHLPGNNNQEFIMNWLVLIGCLFRAAKTMTLEEIEARLTRVNTTSEYRGLVDDVFGVWGHLIAAPHFEAVIEDGIIDVKYLLMGKNTKNKKVGYSAEEIDRILNSLRPPPPVVTVHDSAEMPAWRSLLVEPDEQPARVNFASVDDPENF